MLLLLLLTVRIACVLCCAVLCCAVLWGLSQSIEYGAAPAALAAARRGGETHTDMN